MKVVFGTDENGDSEPVIVEDIEVCVHVVRTCMTVWKLQFSVSILRILLYLTHRKKPY